MIFFCRRTASGVSTDSLGANHGEIEEYDSSDTDSEAKDEAKVITAKKGSVCIVFKQY